MMTGFEQYTRKTRRAIFLEEMEQVVPWRELCGLVEPHYPKAGNGRPPVGVERMLRIYFLQQWFNLSDPAVEESLYDSAVMRQFVGVDLGCEPAPDQTTVCKFRHLLEEHHLGEQILGTVNLHLQAQGVRITTGTIVDATILHAPTSTKNQQQQRDPEMHQTKKGKQWYFGMKAHVGVDSKTKIIHTAVATAALGQLALHVASIPGNLAKLTQLDEFDASRANFDPAAPGDVKEIHAAFDQSIRSAEECLCGMTEQKALGNWRLMIRGKEAFSQPRTGVLRSIMLNHWYHHRGQLSVYLRLLDVPVPVIYGRSADENPFA